MATPQPKGENTGALVGGAARRPAATRDVVLTSMDPRDTGKGSSGAAPAAWTAAALSGVGRPAAKTAEELTSSSRRFGGGRGQCDACPKEAVEEHSCRRCELARYCSPACATFDWFRLGQGRTSDTRCHFDACSVTSDRYWAIRRMPRLLADAVRREEWTRVRDQRLLPPLYEYALANDGAKDKSMAEAWPEDTGSRVLAGPDQRMFGAWLYAQPQEGSWGGQRVYLPDLTGTGKAWRCWWDGASHGTGGKVATVPTPPKGFPVLFEMVDA